MQFLVYLLVPSLVSALAISQRDIRPRALYFLDSNPDASSIVSMKINLDDGTLSGQTSISTGQKGAIALDAPTSPDKSAAPGDADPTFSQHSIVVDGDYIFTVNAGSNSVSMFLIDPRNPTSPKLINSTPSLGNFPISVAYSSALKTACVANSGSIPGVACFSVDHAKGLNPITPLLPIALKNSNPPIGPLNTASDIQFSPSSKYLWLSVKGVNGTTPGSNYIYPIVGGKVSTTPVISSIPTLFAAFGFSFLSETKALITDATGAYDMVAINPRTYIVSLISKTSPAGAQAVCWSAYSPRFNTLFIADGLNTNLTLINPDTGKVKGLLIQDAKGKGALDIALDRSYLYNLRGANSIAVSDLSSLDARVSHGGAISPQVQSFKLSGQRLNFAGLAVYPSGIVGLFNSA